MKPSTLSHKRVPSYAKIDDVATHKVTWNRSADSHHASLLCIRKHAQQRFGIRSAVLVLCFFILRGCTSLQPINLSSEDLRGQVRAGEIARAGDQVSLTTKDGKTQEFEVTEVTHNVIRGGESDVAIDDIVGVHTRQNDRLRTTLAVAGTVVVVSIGVVLDALNDAVDDILQ